MFYICKRAAEGNCPAHECSGQRPHEHNSNSKCVIDYFICHIDGARTICIPYFFLDDDLFEIKE
jgi:hypothetical protein